MKHEEITHISNLCDKSDALGCSLNQGIFTRQKISFIFGFSNNFIVSQQLRPQIHHFPHKGEVLGMRFGLQQVLIPESQVEPVWEVREPVRTRGKLLPHKKSKQIKDINSDNKLSARRLKAGALT